MSDAGLGSTSMTASTLLAIDVGNTRTKWGVFGSDGELKAHGVVATEALATLQLSPAWAGCQRAVVSNVAGEQAKAALDHVLGAMDIRYIRSSAAACGVRSQYRNPAQLGTDRWAALIAAWHHYHAPCVVVSAGTAVTVDALLPEAASNRGIFLGGYILPGLNLMQQSIADKAPGVRMGEGELQDFPANTADALYSGSLNAIAGAVRALAARLAMHEHEAPKIIIAGGDAEAIYELLAQDGGLAAHLAIADNLVLQGLLILESEIR